MQRKEFTNLLLGRTGIIALIIVAVFVLAIVIISFITSKTIVNPIKKLPMVLTKSHGAILIMK